MSDIMRDAWKLLLPKLWKSRGMGINEILEIDFGSSIDGIDVVKYFTGTLELLDYDSNTGKFFPAIYQNDADFVWEPLPKGVNTIAEFLRYREKIDAWRKVAKKISHKRARSLLNKMPLERDFSAMGPQYLGAVAHYLKCQDCRSLGLAKIRQTELEHKKALLIWAESGSYLPKEKPNNLHEVYAAEHVLSCKSPHCTTFLTHWEHYQRNSSGDSINQAVAGIFPILIEVFLRAGWMLDELFTLQRQRVRILLEDAKEAAGDRNINRLQYLMYAVEAQVDALQKMVRILNKRPPRILPKPKPRKLRKPRKPKADLLAEATGGKLHWNDKGMRDWEKGWEPFTKGTRVEVRVQEDKYPPYGHWLKGTVEEEFLDSERAIVVKCDKRWHENMSNYLGHGATIMVMHNTRRGILSRIRKVEGE